MVYNIPQSQGCTIYGSGLSYYFMKELGMNFGEFVRIRRTELGFTLRDFCQTFGHDPSNWSKVERGKLPQSDDQAVLDDWAETLNIKKGTENWQMFSDLAFRERGKIPPDIL